MTDRIAAAYLRRSTATTGNPGNDSREAQEAAVKRLCGPDVALYVDWGVSGGGSGEKRPEYQRLKQDIAAGLVGSVCAYSLTRLGRNARELLALVELCRERDVPLRTSTEGLDTSSAFGRAMLQVMAAFAELELEQGKERSASARAARIERHVRAGLPVPGSQPAYGYRHVPEDVDGGRITRIEPDPSVDLAPIVRAYTEAGSVRGAAVKLNELGIPAPRGGRWAITPLRRILERLSDRGLVALPERNPRTKLRHPAGKALYGGLLICHCGRRMTPNVQRGQYYCAAARSNADHGRMSVTERALTAALRPEADAYLRTILLENRTDAADIARKEAVIERRQAALDARLDVGRITPEAYRAATRSLLGESADLRRNAIVARTLRLTPVPAWPEPGDDSSAMNAHLRRVWTHVQLDPDMHPEAYWRDARWRYDPERDGGAPDVDVADVPA